MVFCSGDEGCAKTDPAAFRTTLDRLDVKPSEAIFIDDTAEHVEAACALGIRGIVFRDARQLARELETSEGVAMSLTLHPQADARHHASADADQEN